jgi:PHD/YefM family antitoxin component YafN of YafNO toxin-antitoxin module
MSVISNLRKQASMFKAQVEVTQKAYAEEKKQHEAEYSRRITAERELNETRKQFADLKERLHNAELTNARNDGYLQRVREDDNVADPLVETEGPEGKRMVSKRHPGNMLIVNPQDEYFHSMNRDNSRKHWVNY